MDNNNIRCYLGSQRVIEVLEGWYRPSRKENVQAQLIVRVLLKNGRIVITRAKFIPGVHELWAAYINSRRKCLQSESSSDESGAEEKDVKVVKVEAPPTAANVTVVLDRLPSPPRQGTSRSSSSSSAPTRHNKSSEKKKAKPQERKKRPREEEDEEEDDDEQDDDGSSSDSSTISSQASPPPRTPGGSPVEVDKSNWLKCTATGCGKMFKTAGGVTNHFRNVHTEGKITCEFCKSTVGYSNLATHKRKCSKNPANMSKSSK